MILREPRDMNQPLVQTTDVYDEMNEVTPPAGFEEHLHDDEPKGAVTRRSVMKYVGGSVVGMFVAGRVASEAGAMYEKQHWGNNPPEFTNGTPELPPTGGNEIILFGGFGEYDTTSYTQGLGKKLLTPTRTIGFRYPAQGYEISDIGTALYEHLRTSRPDKVALYMRSMGAETGTEAYAWAIKHKEELDRQWRAVHDEKPGKVWDLPPISLIAANGSPAGLENATMQDIVRAMLFLHDTTGYTPGVGIEWLYECLDDTDGWQKTIGLQGPKAMFDELTSGFGRALRECPPEVLVSQARALEGYERKQTFDSLKGCAGPYTTFCYLKAKGWEDESVYEKTSFADWSDSAQMIGIERIDLVSTGQAHHASQYGADQRIPAIVDAAFEYTHRYFGRRDDLLGSS